MICCPLCQVGVSLLSVDEAAALHASPPTFDHGPSLPPVPYPPAPIARALLIHVSFAVDEVRKALANVKERVVKAEELVTATCSAAGGAHLPSPELGSRFGASRIQALCAEVNRIASGMKQAADDSASAGALLQDLADRRTDLDAAGRAALDVVDDAQAQLAVWFAALREAISKMCTAPIAVAAPLESIRRAPAELATTAHATLLPELDKAMSSLNVALEEAKTCGVLLQLEKEEALLKNAYDFSIPQVMDSYSRVERQTDEMVKLKNQCAATVAALHLSISRCSAQLWGPVLLATGEPLISARGVGGRARKRCLDEAQSAEALKLAVAQFMDHNLREQTKSVRRADNDDDDNVMMIVEPLPLPPPRASMGVPLASRSWIALSPSQ